jgi:phage terminase large subunit-like protein
VLTGVKPTGVLLDQLHEIAKNPAAERLIGQLRGGLLPNPEGFLMFITTQSDEPPRGAFRSELMVARAIRDGRSQGAMLPILYEFPEEIVNDRSNPPAWQDPKNWWMVTPNRDRSVSIPRLEEDWEKAKLKGQGEIVRWASQHLNIEIGLALRSDRWVGVDFWEQAADDTLTLDALLERSEVVVMGIDGGGLDDLLGLALLGREKGTRRWLLWSKAWANPSVLDRRKSEASLLRDFEAAGELVICKDFGERWTPTVWAPSSMRCTKSALQGRTPSLGSAKAGSCRVRSRRRSGSSPTEPWSTGVKPYGLGGEQRAC